MPTISARGRFLWHELMSNSPTAAIAFYAKAIGWKHQPSENMPDYHLLAWKGVPMAGVIKTPPDAMAMGATPAWMPYFGTDDAHVTAWEAQRLGAKVMREPTVTPGVGTWAILQDPQGAHFAIIAPETKPQAWEEPGLGDFSWHELATTDHKAAFSFYSTLFGWRKQTSDDLGPPIGEYLVFGQDKRQEGGMYTKAPDQPGPVWISYVQVSNLNATAEATKGAGGQVMVGPMEVPGGDMIAIATDKEGAMFAIHQKKVEVRSKVAKKQKPAKKKAAKKAKKVTKRTAKVPKRAKSSSAKKKAVGKKKPAKKSKAGKKAKRR